MKAGESTAEAGSFASGAVPQPAGPHLFGSVVDGLNALGSLVIAAITILMCGDVAMRNLAGRPVDGVAELVAVSITIIVFLQLPATLRHGRMSRADLVIAPLSRRYPATARLLEAFFCLAGAAACAAIAYATWPLLRQGWSDMESLGVEGIFTFPIWPMRFVVLLGASLAALQYLLLGWQELRGAA
jgi:TRAP-type mannitol/chloroaromatic compound transport system permease small subunit